MINEIKNLVRRAFAFTLATGETEVEIKGKVNSYLDNNQIDYIRIYFYNGTPNGVVRILFYKTGFCFDAGEEFWYKNYKLHRDNGPAVKLKNYDLFYKNNKQIKVENVVNENFYFSKES